MFQISEPSLSYSFGISQGRHALGPFEERHTLEFVATCLWPDRFKGRPGEATVYPESALLDETLLEAEDVRRRWIGYIRATKAKFEVVLALKPEVCWRLGEAMASGLARSMLTNGLVETASMNRVTYASFRGADFDPVDYVG